MVVSSEWPNSDSHKKKRRASLSKESINFLVLQY